MPTTTSLRHGAAGLATAGALALTMLPGAAHAGVITQYAAFASSESQYTGSTTGVTCDLSAGSDNELSGIAKFAHGTKRRSVTLRSTYTRSDDSTDRVKVRGHLDSSMTLRRAGRDLRSFALTAGGSLSVSHAISGSSCDVQARVAAGTEGFRFTEHHGGWLYLTRDTRKPDSFMSYELINAKSGHVLAFETFQGTKSHQVSRTRLKPGTYRLEQIQVGLFVGQTFGILKSAPLTRTASQTLHLSGVFKRAQH